GAIGAMNHARGDAARKRAGSPVSVLLPDVVTAENRPEYPLPRLSGEEAAAAEEAQLASTEHIASSARLARNGLASPVLGSSGESRQAARRRMDAAELPEAGAFTPPAVAGALLLAAALVLGGGWAVYRQRGRRRTV